MDDYEEFGECYIHRLHQIIDIDVCHKHHTALINCCPKCLTLLSYPETDEFLATPYCIQGHLIAIESSGVMESLELKLALLKDYEFLLKHVNDIVNSDIEDMLRIATIQRIPRNRFGSVSKNQFIEEFLKNISEEMRNEFQITKEFLMGKHVFPYLFKAKLFTLYPNLFVLMVRFLSGSMEAFFSISNELSQTEMFGVGPWECLNKICPHYQQHVIREYKPFVKTFRHIKYGAFTCDLCGSTYSLGWNPLYKKIGNFRVIDRGAMWKKIVLDHYCARVPVTEIAKIVYSSKEPVQKALIEMNCKSISRNKVLNEVNESLLQVSATIELTERILYHREKLLHMLKQEPNITRIDVGHLSTIKWLTIHDIDWYDKVFPPKKRDKKILDYDQLDISLELKLQEAVKKVNVSKPSHRIMKNTIISILDKEDRSKLLNQKQRFPKSWITLELNVEKLEDYLLRRLPFVMLKLKEYGVKNITWKSMEIRFKIYKNASDRVKEEFEKVVNAINED